jgi:hypothetical protein
VRSAAQIMFGAKAWRGGPKISRACSRQWARETVGIPPSPSDHNRWFQQTRPRLRPDLRDTPRSQKLRAKIAVESGAGGASHHDGPTRPEPTGAENESGLTVVTRGVSVVADSGLEGPRGLER